MEIMNHWKLVQVRGGVGWYYTAKSSRATTHPQGRIVRGRVGYTAKRGYECRNPSNRSPCSFPERLQGEVYVGHVVRPFASKLYLCVAKDYKYMRFTNPTCLDDLLDLYRILGRHSHRRQQGPHPRGRD